METKAVSQKKAQPNKERRAKAGRNQTECGKSPKKAKSLECVRMGLRVRMAQPEECQGRIVRAKRLLWANKVNLAFTLREVCAKIRTRGAPNFSRPDPPDNSNLSFWGEQLQGIPKIQQTHPFVSRTTKSTCEEGHFLRLSVFLEQIRPSSSGATSCSPHFIRSFRSLYQKLNGGCIQNA